MGSGSRLAGDDYQHVLAWWYLLELLIPGRGLESVTVEDPEAGSADDVTLRYAPEARAADQFLQIKFHLDQRGRYSTDLLLAAKGRGRSLLRKLFDSWLALRARGRPVEIHLLSNGSWDSADPVGETIRGEDGALSETFFTAPETSRIGQARERWRAHLGVAVDELRAFGATLRFRLGSGCLQEVEARAAERMTLVGLRDDSAALLAGAGIVRQIVKARRVDLRRTDLEELIAKHRLRRPASAEPAAAVYLSTVAAQRFELAPDFLLDWREHFEGDEDRRGHRVLDPTAWNGTMLPDLRRLERQLRETSAARLVRARGLARLSAWFAFGFVFSDVARYILEVDQQGALWRTDAAPTSLQVIEQGRETIAGGDPDALAVGISVSGPLEEDVLRDLRAAGAAAEALFLRPDRELGRGCLRAAGDAVALARGAKVRMHALARELGVRRVLLYYYGPLSGACFLGHQLNAVAREIQVMEDQQPGYAPSFLLT